MVGQLDLDFVTVVTGLALAHCALPDGITCLLRDIHLDASLFAGLHGDGLRTDSTLPMANTTLTGTSAGGAVLVAAADM